MKKTTDRDVEQLLRGAVVSNPAHKEALRVRLLENATELDPDDLALVAGGAALPDQEAWTPWPKADAEPKKR